MKRLLAFLALAACATLEADPTPAPGFRDRGVPVASAALFDPARFEGQWVVVADYLGPEACAALSSDYRLVAEGVFAVTDRCGAPGFEATHTAGAEITGPGRLQRSSATPFVGETEWVLWVDEGYRTAVLADPAGSGARILDRSADIPSDRLAAAREVLRFNGFDTEPLREVSQ